MKKSNSLADLMEMIVSKPKQNHAKLILVVDVEAEDDGGLVVLYKSGSLKDKPTTPEDAPQIRLLSRLSKLFRKDIDILTDTDEK